MSEPMTDATLRAIALRLDKGCPTQGVTLSPWAVQLVKDAYALLREVERVRAPMSMDDHLARALGMKE